MNDSSVRDLLTQLHAALEGTTQISERDRELLEQLSVDIQATLARPDASAGAAHPTLGARLQAAIAQFEVSHPKLTVAMAQAAKQLGDMGI